MNSITKLIAFAILFFTIGFNLWIYRLEPTAKVDPNDNSFQFALVDRTNAIFDFATKHCADKLGHWSLVIGPLCQMSYLTDHWVPNWAQGYNLPYYYSHLPQIAIVASWRFLHWLIGLFGYLFIGLFDYYHWIIYLALSVFPLSVFLALRVIKLPWIIAGIGAFTASQLSTDGLYGLDPSSFLWRGFGLSSQLFAMIWLPLAIAFSYRYFSEEGERQFLRELASGLVHWCTNLMKGRHLAREAERQDLATMIRAPRKNSSRAFLLTAVLFLVLTTAGHLGIGIMAILGLIPLAIAPIISELLYDPSSTLNRIRTRQLYNSITQSTLMLTLLVGSVVLILSYWIVPVLLHDIYHNTSVWDPVWKFDSYGAKDVLTKLLAGDLFDFGRFPILTLLTLIGFLSAMSEKIFEGRSPSLAQKNLTNKNNQQNNSAIKNKEALASSDPRIFFYEYQRSGYAAFPFLFLFYLLLYFGRTTWGPLIDLIPGMSDFHISRFIVGLHIAGIFLVPLGILCFIETISSSIKNLESRIWNLGKNQTTLNTKFYILNSHQKILHGLITLGIIVLIAYLTIPQTLEYARHNDRLILQANENYAKISKDTEDLLSTLQKLQVSYPGRVYAGRGGNWGKEFRVAETPMYMHISTYGIPTMLWLPETWSPNSDTEQYFSEDRIEDYVLYNLRYAVTPKDKEPLSFWKPLAEGKTWKLNEVMNTEEKKLNNSITRSLNNSTTQAFGYVTSGYDVARVVSDKLSFVNVIRLWINSDNPKLGLYPRLDLQKKISRSHITSSQSLVPSLPFFTMLNEATYQTPDGKTHSLFEEPPVYSVNPRAIEKGVDVQKYGEVKILSQSSDTDMIFKADIEVSDKCTTCLVILRQTYHPSWVASIDGNRVESFPVFPFFTAVKASPGTHDIIFSYEPSLLKKLLFFIFIGTMSVIISLIIAPYISRHISRPTA